MILAICIEYIMHVRHSAEVFREKLQLKILKLHITYYFLFCFLLC